MSQLPAVAQWAGLVLLLIGGWLVGPGVGIATTGAVLLLVGLYNEAPE